MRGIVLTILAIAITVSVAFFLFYREELSEVGEQKAGIGGLPAGQTGLLKTTRLSELDETKGSDLPAEAPIAIGAEAGPAGLNDYIATADKYLDEALPLIEPKDRFVLVDKITIFKDSYESAIATRGKRQEIGDLELLIRATARYIATWSPFYYYIHGDAQSVLGPIIKMLERNRAEMLKELAKQDARRAGRLAAEDIEYYIEDIRKSAARRNSDFITFSLEDYERYRKNFDELEQNHPDFLDGFAENAYILFDDFYRMHEEVDQAYLDKTRKKVEDVRLELRELHKRALLDLGLSDESAARAALDKTISEIERELSSHGDWRSEIHGIMKFDYDFYQTIKL